MVLLGWLHPGGQRTACTGRAHGMLFARGHPKDVVNLATDYQYLGEVHRIGSLISRI